MKNQTELIRTFEAKRWHYDKAESGHVRIWSQLAKKKKGGGGEIQIPSQWISYMVVILIFHYYFEIDIGITYKMIHNNDPAEVQEYA